MTVRSWIARGPWLASTMVALAMCVAAPAAAQWGTDPEEGDTGTGTTPATGTTTTSSDTGTGGTTTPAATTGSGGGGTSASTGTSPDTEQPAPAEAPADGGVRLALQGRFSLVNVQLYGPALDEIASLSSPAPYVTAGVRLPRLFLGIGFGFFGISYSQCGDTDDGCDGDTGSETTQSTTAFSITPLASFDIVQDPTGQGALYLVGWIPLISGGGVDRESCSGSDCMTDDGDNEFWWGLNLGLGARYNITRGVALATEWGWGFLTSSSDGDVGGPADDSSVFAHGIWGNLVFEASIGI